MQREFIAAPEELDAIVKYVRDLLPNGGVVIMRGDLASGKTTFCKAFVKSLGLKDAVTSPTFSLQHRYGERIYHYDLYRESTEKFLALGLLEEIEKPGYHLIEWADEALEKMLKQLGFGVVVVTIEPYENRRRYRIEDA